jgi:polyribonucleotide 5'-hydroxyl-kinase
LDRLSDAIFTRLSEDDLAASAGLIINTPAGLDSGTGLDVLRYCIKSLQVDVVLVIGHDRLYQQLRSFYPKSQDKNAATTTTVIKLPKSGGVVNRDAMTRKVLESRIVKEYFYGPKKYPPRVIGSHETTAAAMQTQPPPALKPFLMEIRQDVLRIWKFVDDMSQSSGGLVPVTGSAHVADPCRLELVSVEDKSILHSLAALIHTNQPKSSGGAEMMGDDFDETEEAKLIASSNVAGFVVIHSVNPDRKTISILAPCPGKLPSTNIIISPIKWMDS